MLFTSLDYLAFIIIVFSAYWLIRNKTLQNLLLLVSSYIFYGYVHPWFCILIALSTIVDYFCGLAIEKYPEYKKLFLVISLTCNLGMLGVFKYFNFFAENFYSLATIMGFEFRPILFKIFLPVGISFYTFQTLSYTIDIYYGKLRPRKSFFDFALFVSFFSQLVAGPIERAADLLPQIESERQWNWDALREALPLLINGYLKKMVIADNLAIYVDKIYMLQHPPFLLLTIGTVAFAMQIYTDFSAYTDIARGSAKLLGFHLVENFNSPYLAISPSDFWRRWHISFSSWIRDYLYIPLGGSRVKTRFQFAIVLLITLGLSGLWHGAAWNFFAWGIYHAILVFSYHRLGCGGRWVPEGRLKKFMAWFIMMIFVIFGWLLFRADSMVWLWGVVSKPSLGISGDSFVVAIVVLALISFYSLPLLVMSLLERFVPESKWAHSIWHGVALSAILTFARLGQNDFIYFQF